MKSIRKDWLNIKDVDKTLYFDYRDYPLKFGCASFQDVRQLYNSEKTSLAKLAPHLTMKSCFPISIERQNVKLVLNVVNELTISALTIHIFVDQQDTRFQSTEVFVKSFSSPYTTSDGEFNLEPFLDEIHDLSTIDCGLQLLQSLAFIAGYSIH